MATTVLLLLSLILKLSNVSDAAITIAGGNQISGYVGDDVTIPWVYDHESDMDSVQWSFIDTSSTTTTVMTQLSGSSAVVVGGFNIVHNNNGNVTLTNAQLTNKGTYTCFVAYTLPSGHASVTGTVGVEITDKTSTTTDDGDNNLGTILGSVFGGIAGVVIICGVVYAIYRYNQGSLRDQQYSTVGSQAEESKPRNTTASTNQSSRSPRPQPPPPAGAGASMHAREESDSAVSRQDVELQESDNKLSKRPMPGIPQGHDSKGRGLSAVYDDDHPMVGVDAPARKAGALDPLHPVNEGTGEQEPKKLKKKKKKNAVDDEEQY